MLVVSGQVEKCLDRRVGPISSMMIRLNIGLAGSAAICAAFPFITKTHSGLLTIVAVLGTLSAIAFSTSYQVGRDCRRQPVMQQALALQYINPTPVPKPRISSGCSSNTCTA